MYKSKIMIAEDDRVAVRNHWTAADSQTGKKLEFRGTGILGQGCFCMAQPVPGTRTSSKNVQNLSS